MRGALEVGDVDLAVQFDQTKEEAGRWFATLMALGFLFEWSFGRAV